MVVEAPRTSAVALLQHRQEQGLLVNYNSPNPPPPQPQSQNQNQSQSRSQSPLQPPQQPQLQQQQPQQLQQLPDDVLYKNEPLLSLQQHPDDSSQHSQHPQQHQAPRTLWMGDLDPWLDELALVDIWWKVLQKQVTVKIIKQKLHHGHFEEGSTQSSAGGPHSGYCFVEFETFDDAQEALSLNGLLLPDIAMPSQQEFPNNPDNQKKYFRLNWASGATLSAPIVQTPEYSLFVGDLSASTTEAHLLAFFQESFPNSIKTVRVMTDPVSGKSRCFGFVRFLDDSTRQQALVELQGAWFGGRPLRLALATPRSRPPYQQNQLQLQHPLQAHQHPQQQPQQHGFQGYAYNYRQYPQGPALGGPGQFRGGPGYFFGYDGKFYDPQQAQQAEASPDGLGDAEQPPQPLPQQFLAQNQPPLAHQHPQNGSNTTVFVGGLSSDLNEQSLYMLFKPFGLIQQIKIPPGKNCGFIKYTLREEAEVAIAEMQGYIIGGNRVRLSWGRVSPANRKYQQQQHLHHQLQLHHHHQILAPSAQLDGIPMGMDPALVSYPFSPPAVPVSVGGPGGPGSGPNGSHGHPGMAFPMMPPLHMQMPPPPHGFQPADTEGLAESMESMAIQERNGQEEEPRQEGSQSSTEAAKAANCGISGDKKPESSSHSKPEEREDVETKAEPKSASATKNES